MNCPKCNTQLDDNAIKCPTCGMRIRRSCPVCKTYNLITNKTCINCGEILLKTCPNCKSINLATVKNCRKCGKNLDSSQSEELQDNINNSNNNEPEMNVEIPAYNANYYTITTAKETILNSIKAENIKVISINGNNELGKHYVFNNLVKDTSAAGIAWMVGKCTPHTQLTPLGYFQNVLLNIFNVANFCIDLKQLKKESIKFFKQDFSILSSSEIQDLVNIIYPSNVDVFQNIERNKQNTIRIIVKVFETILQKMNAVLVVENIEYIDSFSYELLNILIENDSIRDKLTLLITYSKERSGVNCIISPVLSDNNYADITIAQFNKGQLEPILDNYKDFNPTPDLRAKILHFGQSNPILLEQLINMTLDAQRVSAEIKLSDNLNSILEYRLSLLKAEDYNTYLILCAASILGFKFYSLIIDSIFEQNINEIEQHCAKLVKLGYIIPTANYSYEFKTLKLWNMILEIIKKDSEIFRAVNQALYPLVSNYTLSTTAILGYLAQNLEFAEQTFTIWMHCTQLAAYIGDTGLYIVLQKQLLSIIDNLHIENAERIKRQLYSELGKLLELHTPELAMEYLTQAVMLLDDSEFVEKIELLGYLASCSIRTKNYHGAIECLNNVLPLIPDNFPVELAIIKSRQLKPLFSIGNCGAIINLVDNDILPTLEAALNNKIQSKIIPMEIIFKTWINVNLNLAKAMIAQGDNKAFNILESLLEVYKNNNLDDNNLHLNINTYLAFAHTMSGNIRVSIEVLDNILSAKNEIPTQIMSKINLISILNRFFMNKNDLSYDELFQATKYADDINDEFTKNILKLLLGRLMQDRTSAKEAILVYTKQIEYFAEKQNAIGVLLGWYFISEAKMAVDGPASALDIAMKALDIAESANISNHYFTLLLNGLVGEIYITLQDFDAAKMYIEKAMVIAKNYGIEYQLVNLYLLYSKYLQDYTLSIKDNKVEYILSAQQMIKKAATIADKLKLLSLSSSVEKAYTVLNSYCQMNGIVLNN